MDNVRKEAASCKLKATRAEEKSREAAGRAMEILERGEALELRATQAEAARAG